MKHLILHALLIGAGLTLGAAPAPPKPTLCRVIATRTPGPVPTITRVSVHLRPECPRGSVADVRLASPIGGTDPRDGHFHRLRYGEVWTRPGVLNYWRVQWRSVSGKTYIVPLGGAP